MQPKLAITTRGSGGDYRFPVEFATGNGFDGIDWNLDFFRVAVSVPTRRKFVDAALGSGLPSRFHAPCQDVEIAHGDPEIAGASLEYLKLYIRLLEDFPGAHFNLHIGSRSIPESELSWDAAVRNLRELVRYGRDHGIVVCFENLKHGWTRDPAKLAALAEASDAAVTLDIGHARATLRADHSEISLEEYVQPFAGRIRDLHLYEIESVEGKHIAPENLDAIRPILRWALQQGVDWWVIELTSYDEILRTQRMLAAEFK